MQIHGCASRDLHVEHLESIIERLDRWREACSATQRRLKAELDAYECAQATERSAQIRFEAEQAAPIQRSSARGAETYGSVVGSEEMEEPHWRPKRVR